MVNTRHTTFDPSNPGQGNRDPLPSQHLLQDLLENAPPQTSHHDESQDYEGGTEYEEENEEEYYEEENEGEYHDEAADPEIPEGEPNQQDLEVTRLRQQVLDQEARIAEQAEAHQRMQESLQALTRPRAR